MFLFALFLFFSFNSKLQPAKKQKKFLLSKRPLARPRISYLSPLFSPHPSIAILTRCFGGIVCDQVGGANLRVTSLARSSPSYLLACVQAYFAPTSAGKILPGNTSQAPSNCTNQTPVIQKVDPLYKSLCT